MDFFQESNQPAPWPKGYPKTQKMQKMRQDFRGNSTPRPSNARSGGSLSRTRPHVGRETQKREKAKAAGYPCRMLPGAYEGFLLDVLEK